MRITLLPSLKVDFRSKLLLFTYIHLYSIATKYFWNNALVEYIDNCSCSLVIIYQNCQKQYLTGQSLKNFITCRQFESKKSNVVLFFLWDSFIRCIYYTTCMINSSNIYLGIYSIGNEWPTLKKGWLLSRRGPHL